MHGDGEGRERERERERRKINARQWKERKRERERGRSWHLGGKREKKSARPALVEWHRAGGLTDVPCTRIKASTHDVLGHLEVSREQTRGQETSIDAPRREREPQRKNARAGKGPSLVVSPPLMEERGAGQNAKRSRLGVGRWSRKEEKRTKGRANEEKKRCREDDDRTTGLGVAASRRGALSPRERASPLFPRRDAFRFGSMR